MFLLLNAVPSVYMLVKIYNRYSKIIAKSFFYQKSAKNTAPGPQGLLEKNEIYQHVGGRYGIVVSSSAWRKTPLLL